MCIIFGGVGILKRLFGGLLGLFIWQQVLKTTYKIKIKLNSQCKVFQMNLNANLDLTKKKIQFALPYTPHKCLFSLLHLAQLPCVVRARECQTHVLL